MKKLITHYITISNKKYSYILIPKSNNSTYVECKDANIGQEFLNEDVPALLSDLPNLILAEKEYNTKQSEVIRFRVSEVDKEMIEKKAVKNGFPSVSGYLRDLVLRDE